MNVRKLLPALLLAFFTHPSSFAQSMTLTPLPNGLMQLPPDVRNCRVSDGNSVYFIDDYAVFRPVTAEGNSNVWGGDVQGIPIDAAFVQRQTIGPLIDKDVFVARSPGDPTIYLIDHGKKRGIRGETWESCQIKLSQPAIHQMSDGELAAIPNGPNLEVVLTSSPCGANCGQPSPPEPMDVKSTSCGTFNVTTAKAACPAWHQHAECWKDSGFGSCTPKCECKDGAAIHPPPSLQGPSCSIAPNPNYFCKLGNESADAAAHGDGGCWAGRCATGFHPVCAPAKCEPPVSHMSSCGCAPN